MRRSAEHDDVELARIYEAGEHCKRVLTGLSRLIRRLRSSVQARSRFLQSRAADRRPGRGRRGAGEEIVESVLAGAGFRVRSASSVAEALGAFETTPAELVVTDLRMPGAGGEELYTRLADRGCRFVFMTGDTLSPDTADFLARGRGASLPKPFTREDLLKAVAAAR